MRVVNDTQKEHGGKQVLRIIIPGLVFAPITLLIVCGILQALHTPLEEENGDGNFILILAGMHVLMFIVTCVLAEIFPRLILKRLPADAPRDASNTLFYIIRYALLEGSAFFGGVVILLGVLQGMGTMWWLWLNTLSALYPIGQLLADWPRISRGTVSAP